eukprot:1012256-Alexandrium_andersonii.AAC.1
MDASGRLAGTQTHTQPFVLSGGWSVTPFWPAQARSATGFAEHSQLGSLLLPSAASLRAAIAVELDLPLLVFCS